MNDAPEGPPPFLSKADCEQILSHVMATAHGGGHTMVQIRSRWTANVRWARNRITVSGDSRNNTVTVNRAINGSGGAYIANQITQTDLAKSVAYAERFMGMTRGVDEFPPSTFEMPHLQPTIWDEPTFRQTATARNDAAQPLMDLAEAAGLLSAGYIQIEAGGHAVLSSHGLRRYYPYTSAQYSVTVREPGGRGSGWAGVDWNAWSRIDAARLTQRALDKCLASLDPVRIEPGRYTAILEPQAVADLLGPMMGHLNRLSNEQLNDMPFFLDEDVSKIGLRLLDERITITADVMDPDLGWVPFDWAGEPYLPAVWFDRGVLRDLGYNHQYAVKKLGKNEPLLSNAAARMSGGDVSIDEMIDSTKRGVLVTRFSGVDRVDLRSLLYTGYTRDGLWLIENGKISKAINNFKFTESPLFVFSNVVQLGPPERVFSPGTPMVVPPLKINDFSFTSLTDAV